jgi:hypothetical protein
VELGFGGILRLHLVQDFVDIATRWSFDSKRRAGGASHVSSLSFPIGNSFDVELTPRRQEEFSRLICGMKRKRRLRRAIALACFAGETKMRGQNKAQNVRQAAIESAEDQVHAPAASWVCT